MTIEERNELKDRERIKQFLEVTMRQMCDDVCDNKIQDIELLDNTTKFLLDYSQIYRNMGFDKEGGKE